LGGVFCQQLAFGSSIHQQGEGQLGDNAAMTTWYIKDEFQETLAPLSDLRASFEQRTGGLTTLARLTQQMGCPPSGFLCDDALRAEMITNRTGLPRVEGKDTAVVEHPTIETPWDVLTHLPDLLARDLQHAQPQGSDAGQAQTYGEYHIDVHHLAQLFPGVVLDASKGAIRIEENAVIRPNAVICGPCWIGEHCTITDGALIKSNTVLGPHCKVGGEVGGTIFQGYANKSHDGHLGDSVVGEWVNFGAGTTNSNLLNTYGDVILSDLTGKRHKTGRQFVGCFVGDHVKFAICSKIMTGTMIGTGAMVATTMQTTSPTKRFAWITDSGERSFRIEKFLDVAKLVMQRRGKILDEASEKILRKLADG
jgi:UDP-N-acetylglucosamine diphosphorylase/glucosamine-1-phosphate N-acetyltransferase